MTPTNPKPAAPGTRDLLRALAEDTRRDLRRFQALAAFLSCPFVLAPSSRRRAAMLVDQATIVLRAMLSCIRQTQRAFRRKRYARCLGALKRFERLRRVLEFIDRDAALAVLSSITEGRRHGRRG